jgi:hypothetical protein
LARRGVRAIVSNAKLSDARLGILYGVEVLMSDTLALEPEIFFNAGRTKNWFECPAAISNNWPARA